MGSESESACGALDDDDATMLSDEPLHVVDGAGECCVVAHGHITDLRAFEAAARGALEAPNDVDVMAMVHGYAVEDALGVESLRVGGSISAHTPTAFPVTILIVRYSRASQERRFVEWARREVASDTLRGPSLRRLRQFAQEWVDGTYVERLRVEGEPGGELLLDWDLDVDVIWGLDLSLAHWGGELTVSLAGTTTWVVDGELPGARERVVRDVRREVTLLCGYEPGLDALTIEDVVVAHEPEELAR